MSLIMWGEFMEELKQQFDELTERKKAIWATLTDRLAHDDIYYGYAHEKEPEWKEIVELDRKLIALSAQIKGGNA
jgi:hypothetical protein